MTYICTCAHGHHTTYVYTCNLTVVTNEKL